MDRDKALREHVLYLLRGGGAHLDFKSAFADLWTLTGIWSGQSAPSAAYDYRTFVRQLWGVGSF